MRIETQAIVCALRSHGEHGAVVRMQTPEDGLQAAYLRGARGRRMRPVLMPGNLVQAQMSARTESQLPQATVELIHSRGALLSEPLPAAAIEWVTALIAASLPEGQPYPRLYEGLSGLLDAIEHAPSARGWLGGLVRFEQLVLAELGYGEVSGKDLRANGRALETHLFAGRKIDVMAARERLVERLNRFAPSPRA